MRADGKVNKYILHLTQVYEEKDEEMNPYQGGRGIPIAWTKWWKETTS